MIPSASTMFLALTGQQNAGMNDIDLTLTLTLLAILGAGLNGGVYFSFSTFTMAALRRLPPGQGAAAMQAVNIEAVRPAFMSLFFGTAVVSLAAAILALLDLGDPGSPLVIAGSASYLSSIVSTAAYNVPLNDRLATVDPESAEGRQSWATYQRRWTRGNHLRAIVCSLAVVLLGLSLVS